MDLLEIANTLKIIGDSDTGDTYARQLGFVHLTLNLKQWEDVKRLIAMLDLACLVNIKTAQDSFPRLLQAVKLILAIADNPGQNPGEQISLATKTRAQLDSAVKFAEKSKLG
jgi:hypothetical protein